ncbi:MAG: hypothetical protein HKO59_16210 [Phycisphaerales bacterium]|nr:hypothetical protein [Phycisphaerae bacterium]NNF42930.1 hypothetical protein [Phycisphaerales bacterium]NNM27496.1 hypothetical protein [Phycisphaerales bacterium]
MSAAPSDMPHDTLKLFLLAGLLILFLVAVPMMFVHPGITIILVWVGLVVLAGAALVHRLMRRST